MLLKPVNLALVDDHALFRKSLVNFLVEQKNLFVTVQASDMSELFTKLKDAQSDLLLMDIFLPGVNANDALRALRRDYPELKILALSMSADIELISDMLEIGIHGYISKADEPEDLLTAIQAIANGRIFRNKHFTEALYWNKQNKIKAYMDQPFGHVTDREKKILQMIWEEKSNKEIADQLFLGVRSVEKIRQDLKEKIGVKSTVGLLKYAIEKRIIHPSYLNRAQQSV